MMHTRIIGRVHPSFFDHSYLFRKFKLTLGEKGDVIRLQSPFFVLNYNYDTGELSCDDEEVLSDFTELIHNDYGTNITRSEMYNDIDWNTVSKNYSILNVGVCDLGDNSGWDGSINSIWYDTKAPGRVIDIYFQYWNKKLLLDSWKLSVTDVKKLGGIYVVMPNLIDSLVYLTGSKKEKVNMLISELHTN